MLDKMLDKMDVIIGRILHMPPAYEGEPPEVKHGR